MQVNIQTHENHRIAHALHVLKDTRAPSEILYTATAEQINAIEGAVKSQPSTNLKASRKWGNQISTRRIHCLLILRLALLLLLLLICLRMQRWVVA